MPIMSVYVASATPDSVTEGVQATDHTLQFPFIDTDNGADIVIKCPSTNTGTVKFNARGLASASDYALAAGEQTFVHVWKDAGLSFNKSVTADQFSYSL